MKRATIGFFPVFLIALLPLVMGCDDSPSSPVTDPALVLYYGFNGTVSDLSGSNNHGTTTAAEYTADKWGNAGSAYRFNGVNNHITVPNSPSINPSTQLTICFWLRVDTIAANYMPILVKGGPIEGYFSNREYGVWTKANVTLWYPQFKSAGDSSGMHELDSDFQSYAPGAWTFFTFVVDRVNHVMQIYADGVLTHTTSDSYSTFNQNSHPLIIGWSDEGSADRAPLRGAMDNLRLYTRALSLTEIVNLYNGHL